MTTPNIDIPRDQLADFCRKWKIVELSLFGSVLRDDFGPGSDVDVLVEFAHDAGVTAFAFFDLRDQLASILGRRVDLLTRRAVEGSSNPWFRHAVLSTARTVYAA